MSYCFEILVRDVHSWPVIFKISIFSISRCAFSALVRFSILALCFMIGGLSSVECGSFRLGFYLAVEVHPRAFFLARNSRSAKGGSTPSSKKRTCSALFL